MRPAALVLALALFVVGFGFLNPLHLDARGGEGNTLKGDLDFWVDRSGGDYGLGVFVSDAVDASETGFIVSRGSNGDLCLRGFVHALLGNQVIFLALGGFFFAALAGVGGGLILDNVNSDRRRKQVGWALLLCCGPLFILGLLLGLP